MLIRTDSFGLLFHCSVAQPYEGPCRVLQLVLLSLQACNPSPTLTALLFSWIKSSSSRMTAVGHCCTGQPHAFASWYSCSPACRTPFSPHGIRTQAGGNPWVCLVLFFEDLQYIGGAGLCAGGAIPTLLPPLSIQMPAVTISVTFSAAFSHGCRICTVPYISSEGL